MVLSLDFSSTGLLGEVLHAELVPSCSQPQSSALCHICVFCPFQSYLVSGGPSGSLSHLPPPGCRMSLPWPPMLLGRMQDMYQGTQGTQSLQPFWASSRGGATSYLLGASMVRHFCSGSIPSFHLDPSVDASAKTAGVRGWFHFRLTGLISLLYNGLWRIFSSTAVEKLNSLAFTLSYGSDRSSVHDYWKNHSFDTIDLCSKVSLCFLIHCAGFS